MSNHRAVVVDPSHADHLVVKDVAPPQPQRNEALVRVKAFSLNRGEVRRAASAPAGFRPGWDFAGVIEQPASDGSGPRVGTRVVGMCTPTAVIPGAWTTVAAAPTNAIAPLPDNVSFEVASTLPVAGLTALHSLYKGGFLLGKPILVTGATGGTGDFTIQLAKLAGATVVALCRSKDRVDDVKRFGADQVIVGDDPTAAKEFGPYPLIVDSVGGALFGKVNGMLATNGVHIIFGTTGGNDLTFTGSEFYPRGMASIYGFILFQELNLEPASVGLALLAKLVSQGKLKPRVDRVESWMKTAEMTRHLMDRKFLGKAVLIVD